MINKIKVDMNKQDGDDVMAGHDRSRFSLETHIKNPTTPKSAMTSILSVANVTKSDDADYECIVTNPYGKISHRIKLLVQGKYFVLFPTNHFRAVVVAQW